MLHGWAWPTYATLTTLLASRTSRVVFGQDKPCLSGIYWSSSVHRHIVVAVAFAQISWVAHPCQGVTCSSTVLYLLLQTHFSLAEFVCDFWYDIGCCFQLSSSSLNISLYSTFCPHLSLISGHVWRMRSWFLFLFFCTIYTGCLFCVIFFDYFSLTAWKLFF